MFTSFTSFTVFAMTGPTQTVATRLSPAEMDALQRWVTSNDGTMAGALRLAARQLVADTEAAPAAHRGPAQDEASGRLGVLLTALDGVGLTGQLGDARRMLARAEQLMDGARAEEHTAATERGALVDALAAGTVTPEQVAARLAVIGAWLGQGTPPAWVAVHQAVAELRRQAVAAARQDMLGAHKALADRAAVVVKRAVEHGRRLVDCKRVARLLEPPPMPRQIGNGPRVHPWVDNPPTLPTVSLDSIQGDSGRLVAWGEASSAYAEFRRIVEVADLLHAAGGPASAVLGVGHDSDALHIVEADLPELLHLAVFDALGWRPGLYASLKPRPNRQAVEVRPQWTPPRPVRVGPNGQGW